MARGELGRRVARSSLKYKFIARGQSCAVDCATLQTDWEEAVEALSLHQLHQCRVRCFCRCHQNGQGVLRLSWLFPLGRVPSPSPWTPD